MGWSRQIAQLPFLGVWVEEERTKGESLYRGGEMVWALHTATGPLTPSDIIVTRIDHERPDNRSPTVSAITPL